MSTYPVLYLRSAQATNEVFTVNGTLTVLKGATAPTDAVNRKVLDDAIALLGASGSSGLAAEAQARTDADSALSDRITQEVADREAGATGLSDRIDAEEAARIAMGDTGAYDLGVERDARVAADDALSDRITDEVTAREAGATGLSDRIDSEEAARIAMGATGAYDLGVERDARVAADDALSGRIDAEEAARIADVNTEEAARLAGDVALQAQISDVHIAPYASAIYADGGKPLPMTLSMVNDCHQGWYFKNDWSQTAPNGSILKKINWYAVNNSKTTPTLKFEAKVGTIKEINIPLTLISKTSVPFITIYTKPIGATGSAGGNAASWYRAKQTWTFDGDVAAGAPVLADGGNYLFRINVNATSLTASYPDYTNVDLKVSVVASATAGTFSLDDDISLIAFSTDSGSAQNNVSFVAKHFEMRTSLGNKKMLFSNDTVLMHRLLEKLEVVNQELYTQPVL